MSFSYIISGFVTFKHLYLLFSPSTIQTTEVIPYVFYLKKIEVFFQERDYLLDIIPNNSEETIENILYFVLHIYLIEKEVTTLNV